MDGAAGAEAQDPLLKAHEALRAGDWSGARERFEAALAREERGEALFGLGVALQWLGDSESAIRHWERAYADFRRRRDAQQSVLAAFYLCLGYRMILGNGVASRGWCERAASVVENLDVPELNGWVELARAYVANESGHPSEGELHARKALASARETQDSDLELCAKSELGAALVANGRVEEGTALLDEAMAGALAGEGNDLDTVVLISCRTVASCDRGGDVRRATQWVRAADEFNRRYGSPHLYTTCRTHYGGILFAAGKWADAERELEAALEVGKAVEPDLHVEALARLSELRLAQGRTEEAGRLLEGYGDHPVAARVIGAIHLARDEPDAASSVLARRLAEVDERTMEGVALSELLVEAEIARGRPADATPRAERLAELASRVDSQLYAARAQRALGRVRAAAHGPAAIPPLETALTAFRRLGMPFEAARTRLLIATALSRREPHAAIADARAALAGFEALGAGPGADAAAALLRSLGVKAARSGPRGVGLLTKREREVLELLGEGLSNPAIAERLFITRKTVEHHVGSVLSKLGLSGRSEATAYAVRHLTLERDSAAK
ncbi:MAG TPA: LuxR C-terminal-related transcriptional regulator [Gaiella sp.]|nr:LuxR C-terminal-related transcriptional regulator [Gaiella sp.]